MTKQEKIDKIYEVIADKTLSFGCKVDTGEWDGFSPLEGVLYMGNNIIYESDTEVCADNNVYEIEKIIGHPVMYGDTVAWMEEHDVLVTSQGHNITFNSAMLHSERKDKRKPIDDQSAGCIDFVYSLI